MFQYFVREKFDLPIIQEDTIFPRKLNYLGERSKC
jgi:hypothetical protein